MRTARFGSGRGSDDAEWWIAALNYTGSIFFMIAAVTSFTLPTTGQVVNLTLVNSGAFLGALCFLVGAYLLLPPADEAGSHARTA